MKALIDPTLAVQHIVAWADPTTPIYGDYPNSGRVCQVEPDDQIFPVAEPFYWTDCPNDCVADAFWCDLTTNAINPIENAPKTAAEDQPVADGLQTL